MPLNSRILLRRVAVGYMSSDDQRREAIFRREEFLMTVLSIFDVVKDMDQSIEHAKTLLSQCDDLYPLPTD